MQFFFSKNRLAVVATIENMELYVNFAIAKFTYSIAAPANLKYNRGL